MFSDHDFFQAKKENREDDDQYGQIETNRSNVGVGDKMLWRQWVVEMGTREEDESEPRVLGQGPQKSLKVQGWWG